MRLPQNFLNDMREMLGEDYEPFITSYDNRRTHGLRVNTLKISPEAFKRLSPVPLEPVPWCDSGFYYDGQEWLTRHPYYHAGLFYIQEPTAMAPVEELAAMPGQKVIDWCSAPGGKAVQLAGKLRNQGVLFANDLNFNRLKAVIRNIEKYGVTCAVVVSEGEDTLADRLAGQFDRVLIDAPCSGEGMFRKDERMVRSYEQDDLSRYLPVQGSLLTRGIQALHAGGRLVYSTCTFNRRENEDQIERALDKAGGMALRSIRRLMPHEIRGEGHFVAGLEKSGETGLISVEAPPETTPPEPYLDFEATTLVRPLTGHFRFHKDRLYLSPVQEETLRGLNVVRNGLYLGELKRGRFEPAHALAMSQEASVFKRTLDLSADSDEVMKYLRGETLRCDGEPGYLVVTVDGYPLGWGKWSAGVLKNKYPPALRIMK